MSKQQPENELSVSAINLRKLIPLRLFIVVFFAVMLVVTVFVMDISLPLWYLVGVLVAMLLLAGMTAAYVRYGGYVSERVLFTHIVTDVAMLTALLYLSGGWTNPFVSLYLLPLALTATVLPGLYTWFMVGITSACYTFLVFWNVPMPPSALGLNLHAIGMWMGFLLASLAIAFFVVRVAATLKERDIELSRMREDRLRNKQMMALATLAAGAAHELGTPLGTMAILLNDSQPDKPLSHEQVGILRSQVQRCKEIIGSVAASAGVVRAEGGKQVQLDECIRDVVSQWQATRPQAKIKTSYDESNTAPVIVADRTLSQAILNILDNAAEASDSEIEFNAAWRNGLLKIEVIDQGAGLSPEIKQDPGKPFISTKTSDQGMGLGLFLVQSTMDRLGGHMEFVDREGGGTICRLELPLAQLLVNGE